MRACRRDIFGLATFSPSRSMPRPMRKLWSARRRKLRPMTFGSGDARTCNCGSLGGSGASPGTSSRSVLLLAVDGNFAPDFVASRREPSQSSRNRGGLSGRQGERAGVNVAAIVRGSSTKKKPLSAFTESGFCLIPSARGRASRPGAASRKPSRPDHDAHLVDLRGDLLHRLELLQAHEHRLLRHHPGRVGERARCRRLLAAEDHVRSSRLLGLDHAVEQGLISPGSTTSFTPTRSTRTPKRAAFGTPAPRGSA